MRSHESGEGRAEMTCSCGSGAHPLDCCAPWTWPLAERDAALDTLAAELGLEPAAFRHHLTVAGACVDLAPRLGPVSLPPREVASRVRRAWLLAGRAPDEPHLVAAALLAEAASAQADTIEAAATDEGPPRAEPDASAAPAAPVDLDTTIYACHHAWARLVQAAPPEVLRALYGDVLHLVTERLLAWIAATDLGMYQNPAWAPTLYAGLRGVRARFVLLPDARDLDLAELFFAQINGDLPHADALMERLTRVAPTDPHPYVERAAACLFPCLPGVTPDTETAIRLLEAALPTADPELAETWDLAGRLARLRQGQPWEVSE